MIEKEVMGVFDEDGEQERLTFEVFNELVEISRESLLVRAETTWFEFFTSEHLHTIASEVMEKDRVKWETDFDEQPGVYIFTDLVNRRVMKIGETSNVRVRIANAHLRYWNQSSEADFCGYYHARGLPWPQLLQDDEITLCIILVPGISRRWRLALEYWLQEKLQPEIDH